MPMLSSMMWEPSFTVSLQIHRGACQTDMLLCRMLWDMPTASSKCKHLNGTTGETAPSPGLA